MTEITLPSGRLFRVYPSAEPDPPRLINSTDFVIVLSQVGCAVPALRQPEWSTILGQFPAITKDL
ncbi:MAG TPA: hypothetical protein VJV03_16770 [Pyrinomonadaceae bacterium]|nr:hypothetical protein [Pyrinomonadaceae bacterium]